METTTTNNLYHGWPEPVVPVQILSNSGISTVPQQYIRPPSERPTARSTAITTPTGGGTNNDDDDPNLLTIPVIDLSGFFLSNDDTPADQRRQAVVAQQVGEACRTWGFFQVVNHGVDVGVVSRMRAAWREFFALPVEAKAVFANSPATYEGYGSRLGVEEGSVLDWSDYFFLNLLPSGARNLEKWPEVPAGNLREATDKYSRELMNLCEVLLRAISSSLGLDEAYLHGAFGGAAGASACMRVNYYPRCPQPDVTLGLAAHSDPGGITLLLVDDDVAGTQVRGGDGDAAWVTVQPVPGAFVVNVGDQLQILSNGAYRSVEHRALASSGADRLTIAFFCNPRGDLPIAPAAPLVTPGSPAAYGAAVTFDEYRKYVRTRGARGREQVQALSLPLASSNQAAG